MNELSPSPFKNRIDEILARREDLRKALSPANRQALLRAEDRVNQTYEEHEAALIEVSELRQDLGLSEFG